MAFATDQHGLDGQRLQVQIVLALLQFALQQLVILATGDWRLATGDWRLATGDRRVPG
ncbi:hypothetical protein [Pseudomonas sp. BBP2017]|uniref:hypothetical protein n=1 Tax=Pseudomonas sp. BBP2017 TaxID=2109731 RepID=UPI00130501DC|nr:hypothetical protein [Pseudomonas sp. BBP2017]